MSETDYVIPHSLSFSQTMDIEYGDPYYGTINGGNIYFSKRLRIEDWEMASDDNKQRALFESTYMIDRLNYKGSKTSPTQKLQFPRDRDTRIPRDVEYATYEIAILLLGGYDPEAETRNKELYSSRFGGASVMYQPYNNPLPYVLAGIPSATAWRYLFPYMRVATTVSLVRVD